MNAHEVPSILLCAAGAAQAELRRTLTEAGYAAALPPGGIADSLALNGSQLVVIDGALGPVAVDLCRRLRPQLEGEFVPILFLASEAPALGCRAALEAGADACLGQPLLKGELLAQVRALLRIKDAHDDLAGRAAEARRVNTRLYQLHRQLDYELQLAQRIQSRLLPETLPQVPRVRLAVHYVLRDRVGGDFYDVFRLDENHLGFYVADAMGHGIPASLLTIFIKKGVHPKEVFGRAYRLVPPEEVLQRLNRELLEQRLPDHPFITMAYCLFNHTDGTFQFARAGHPYPLHIPADGAAQLWRQDGLLLGVAEACFPARTCRLRPGDKVLLYSDGIDSARFADQPEGTQSLVACAAHHRALPAEEFVRSLAHDLFDGQPQPDDLTLLAMEFQK